MQPTKLSDTKIKRGHVREDGMVFWQRKSSGIMRWVTREKFEQLTARSRETLRAWCRAHPEVVSARNRKARIGKEAQFAAYGKEWRKQNPEKCRQNKRDWRARNPDKRDASNARFFVRNPGARMELRNRARARDACVPIGPGKPMWTVYEMAKRVTKCTGIKFEVDHVIPLSKGGPHDISNVRVITTTANRRKRNKLPHEIQAS